VADTVLVVPCYNEERRLDASTFATFAQSHPVTLLFVDDGSRDGTATVLKDIQRQAPGHVEILQLARNSGKAEAVRLGLQHAFDTGARIVGYADADLSTPLEELARLIEVTAQGPANVVLGSRVALLGMHIERRASRHYLGRVFATGASLVLGIPVYDTQCGAKCFRASTAMRAALDAPFLSAWAFDVELIGRLLAGSADVPALHIDDFVEVPLRRWRDVGKSKLSKWGMARAAVDLLRIRQDLRRRRASGHKLA
jgi:glycosyltransferase involved in cell wall biosynthesis